MNQTNHTINRTKPLPQSQASVNHKHLDQEKRITIPQLPIIYPESPSINQLLDQNATCAKTRVKEYSIPEELISTERRSPSHLLDTKIPPKKKSPPEELISMTVIIMLNLLTTRTNSTSSTHHHSTDSLNQQQNVTLTRPHHLLT